MGGTHGARLRTRRPGDRLLRHGGRQPLLRPDDPPGTRRSCRPLDRRRHARPSLPRHDPKPRPDPKPSTSPTTASTPQHEYRHGRPLRPEAGRRSPHRHHRVGQLAGPPEDLGRPALVVCRPPTAEQPHPLYPAGVRFRIGLELWSRALFLPAVVAAIVLLPAELKLSPQPCGSSACCSCCSKCAHRAAPLRAGRDAGGSPVRPLFALLRRVDGPLAHLQTIPGVWR